MSQTNQATAKTNWLAIGICIMLSLALAGCGSFVQPVMQPPTDSRLRLRAVGDAATQAPTDASHRKSCATDRHAD